jgi:hypothetical protein
MTNCKNDKQKDPSMDNGHVMRAIFKNTSNSWPILADGPNKLWDIRGISS